MSIELSKVKKSFNHKLVIAPLSLQIDKGQIFGLLGPFGCGKATLIKMIIGMLPIDDGHIKICNNKIPHYGTIRDIGYMAQNDALYTDLKDLPLRIS